MALMETVREIIKEHEFELTTFSGFLGLNKGKKLKLKEQADIELFSDLFLKACETLGTPICVHSEYGYIWKQDSEYLALGVSEEGYNYEVAAFFLFDRLPIGKKLDYKTYAQIDEAIRQILSDNNFACDNFIHYRDKTFTFWGDNSDMQCLLMIKRQDLVCYFLKKELLENGTTKVKPVSTIKKKVLLRNMSALKSAVQDCFIDE